jgi:hypothetical protein
VAAVEEYAMAASGDNCRPSTGRPKKTVDTRLAREQPNQQENTNRDEDDHAHTG